MAAFVTLAADVGLEQGGLASFELSGQRIAVANVDGTLWGFDDACTHRQCSLAEGTLEGAVVTCPCHGSRFDVMTGERLRGPAVGPVRTYPLRQQGRVLEVEL